MGNDDGWGKNKKAETDFSLLQKTSTERIECSRVLRLCYQARGPFGLHTIYDIQNTEMCPQIILGLISVKNHLKIFHHFKTSRHRYFIAICILYEMFILKL